jgi:hypothetical protein
MLERCRWNEFDNTSFRGVLSLVSEEILEQLLGSMRDLLGLLEIGFTL